MQILEDKIEHWSTSEILRAARVRKGEAALISGGPPCQPFSKSAFWSPNRWTDGRPRRPANGRSRSVESFRGLDDPRARLLKQFVRVVKEAEPIAYIMENVAGLSYKTSRPMLDSFLEALGEEGYSTNVAILNAAEYGVPQKRKRTFIIGARNGIKLKFPDPTHCPKSKLDYYNGKRKSFVTARDAIGDLDDGNVKEEERIKGKWGHLLSEVPPGDNYLYFTEKRGHPNPKFGWRSRYWSFLLKLSPSKPSWTIQAQPGPYVGPFHWKNRRLRIPEIKRFQTFPDDYKVCGDAKVAQRQLGDAVPPLLAQQLGTSIKVQLLQAELI